jgi:ABC-2 type transport system ATP-binding protein
MNETVMRVAEVTRVFRSGAGIERVSLELRAGEVVALVGLNGAGKSTLMRTMLGMLRPSGGSVSLNGTDISVLPVPDWAGVGHLIELAVLYPELTVQRNLELSAGLRAVPDVRAAVEDVIHQLGIEPYRTRRARALSLGNKQRAALAAALVHDPRLIVLDEPTNALDPAGVILLRESLLRRAAQGAAVLVRSHHLDEVARIADRILMMNAGRLIGTLDPDAGELERAFFEAVRVDDETRSA